jgi:TolB protein
METKFKPILLIAVSLFIQSFCCGQGETALRKQLAILRRSILSVFLVAILLPAGICHAPAAAFALNSNEGDFEFIAFYSDRSGNRDIYRMNPDGSGLVQLTTGTAGDLCPAVSPDGKKIAFLSDRDGSSEIYVMNADGSNQNRITNNAIPEEHASWSPDGTRIYFMRDYSSRTEIWVMESDGSNPVRLTNNQCRDERPFLSPDGQTILFMSNRNGNYEIYMMDSDGSNQRRITNSTGNKVFPVWSPDGSKIAYGVAVISGGTPQGDIHVMKSDGTGDVTLTSANGRDEDPCWSADGSKIVFQSERDGNFEVYVMNSDGSNQSRLTNHPSWDGWPSWGRDSTQTGTRDKTGEIRNGIRLYQNYPNPFNLETAIDFEVPGPGVTSLKIYNPSGQEVAELAGGFMQPGIHRCKWNRSGCPGGIYFYSLFHNDQTVTGKLVIAN